MGDAEIISAAVLLQLAYPGAPVFHSLMQAWADPRTGAYVSYPLDSRAALCAGRDGPPLGDALARRVLRHRRAGSPAPGSRGVEVALDPFWAGLTGPEIVTGMGLDRTYTLLYPEAIILDDDIYQRARYALLALDVGRRDPGPRRHRERRAGRPLPGRAAHPDAHAGRAEAGLTHQLGAEGGYRDPVEVARERVAWIRENHHPEPLEEAQQAELARILAAADREIG